MTNLESDMTFPTYGGEVKPATGATLFALGSWPGRRAGAEVVQLYISDLKSSLPRPVKELKAFTKVSLRPGESRDVTLTIDNSALSFYDDTHQAWTSEPGDFEALVGNASDKLNHKMRFRLE